MFLDFTNIEATIEGKKLPWKISEKQFQVPRNTVASLKVGIGVISLLWRLRCHCNPDHSKLSSLSNTAVVVVFPSLCQWQRSLCSNLGGIDPEKPLRAVFKKKWNMLWTLAFNYQGTCSISNFRVTRLTTKLQIWKRLLIILQIKQILTRKVFI